MSEMMTERDAILDDILSRWHDWQIHRPSIKGWNTKALVVGEFRVSRQYDDVNGALDDALDDLRMRQVDFEVDQMTDPHRSAIYCLARSLHVGAMVFSSPRLPQDREERAHIVEAARSILTARLLASGVM